MSRLPRQSNRQELDAFEQVCMRLGGFAPHVHFEWADGFLAALATAPIWPPREGWLQALADDAFDRAFADPEDCAFGLRVLNTRLSVLRDQLDPEALSDRPDLLRLDPLLAQPTPAQGDEPGFALAESWAGGAMSAIPFVHGGAAVELGSPLADEFEVLLKRIAALAEPGGTLEEATRDEQLADTLFALQDLRLWALDTLPPIETRRVEKTPGRNEPCPCGSGKKYKKCHGA